VPRLQLLPEHALSADFAPRIRALARPRHACHVARRGRCGAPLQVRGAGKPL